MKNNKGILGLEIIVCIVAIIIAILSVVAMIKDETNASIIALFTLAYLIVPLVIIVRELIVEPFSKNRSSSQSQISSLIIVLPSLILLVGLFIKYYMPVLWDKLVI